MINWRLGDAPVGILLGTWTRPSAAAARSYTPGRDHPTEALAGAHASTGTPVITRVDLRGAEPGASYRDVLPRAALDVEVAARRGPPDLRGRPAARRRRGPRVDPAARRRRRRDDPGAAPRRWPPRSTALDPAVRAALEEAARRARTVHEAQRRERRRRRGRRRAAPSPSAGCRSAGSGSTCRAAWSPTRRSVVMNVVPAQVAGVGSLAVASPPQRDNGGLPHPVVLAACALLGVDEVHAVGGAQAIAMFAYGTDGLPADRPGHRAGQRLRRGGQAAAARRRRHRRRGRPDRDRHPRRRHRRPAASSPPTWSRRPSTTPTPPACWSPPTRRCSTRSTPSSPLQVPGHPAPRAGRDRAARPVGATSSSTTSSRASPSSTRGRPSTWRSSPATPAPWADRVTNAGAVFVGPCVAGVARRLPRRLQPRAADRRHRAAHRRAVGAVVPAQRARRRVHPRRAGRGRAAHRRPRRRRGPAPPTSTRSGRASRDEPRHR